jgi:hypothetical protein
MSRMTRQIFQAVSERGGDGVQQVTNKRSLVGGSCQPARRTHQRAPQGQCEALGAAWASRNASSLRYASRDTSRRRAGNRSPGAFFCVKLRSLTAIIVGFKFFVNIDWTGVCRSVGVQFLDKCGNGSF